MKLQYLGTGAAEGIPGLFCQCDVCKDALLNKGKNIRGRCGMIIDETMMIDFPPDVFMQVLLHDIDLHKVNHLFISHSHHDHFAPGELAMRKTYRFCDIGDGSYKLHVYGNEQSKKVFEEALEVEFHGDVELDFFEFHLLEAFKPIEADGYKVTPFPAEHKHNENAFNYLVERGGKTFYYGHDTGEIYDSIYDYLKQHEIKLNAISLDCTNGVILSHGSHMGMPNGAEIVRRLKEQDSLAPDCRLIFSHFGHNNCKNHAHTAAEAEEYGFIAAYDGMKLSF